MSVNRLQKLISIFVFILITVHLVKCLSASKGKSSDGKLVINNCSDDLLVESSNRKTRVLTPSLSTPLYVPSESKNYKKSTKPKKKYKNVDKEEEYTTEDNSEYNSSDGQDYVSQKSYKSPYSEPKVRPVVKYVPIPVYLSQPKTTTPSPYASLSIEDLMAINMAVKNIPNQNSGGYSPMGVIPGMGYSPMGMGVNSGMSYSPMGMTANYGMNPINSYVMSGGRNRKNSGQGTTECPESTTPNSNSKYDSGGNGYGSDGMAEETTTQSPEVYEPVVKQPKAKKTSNKYKKKSTTTTTTTTTEQPVYEEQEPKTEASNDNLTKAKQIAKMLEMLDKWN